MGDDSPFMMLVWILPIIIFVFYGQRIQLYISSNEIKKNIKTLAKFKDDSRTDLIGYLDGVEKSRIDTFLDYFTIMPVDMDPNGIISKVRHVIRSREKYTKKQLETLCPDLDQYQLSKVLTLLEITTSLKLLHKIINHLFLTARKQNNYPLIVPLQMMLPFIMEEARSLKESIPAFKLGQPIGDGIGPMVVGKMMIDTTKYDIDYQAVYSETKYNDKTLYLLKALGPMSTVGHLGDAAESLICDKKINAVIMIDAALKFEGEDSANIAHGFGAAIGGIGTEKFQIEEIATKNDIPIFSIIIKQSVFEAINVMSKDIAQKADDARKQVYDIIDENIINEKSILVIGVGNTMGISQ